MDGSFPLVFRFAFPPWNSELPATSRSQNRCRKEAFDDELLSLFKLIAKADGLLGKPYTSHGF